MKAIFWIFSLFFSGIGAMAQTIPVGLQGVDESLRTLQLQGKLDIKYSLASRPFFTDQILTTDSILRLIDSSAGHLSKRQYFHGSKAFYELLPVSFDNQFNSHHPYGWNHAGMIDAKGYQGLVSTGVYAEIGPVSIQCKPEFVYAMNPGFAYSTQYGAPTKGAYHRVFAGQSSIRLHAGPVSVGLSTENMWWGPGTQNSLLMSNNAPGFLHLVLNTTRPIKTPIGDFEFQLIAGKLTEDTTVLLENSDLTTFYYNQGSYSGLSLNAGGDTKSWRYLNAISVSYAPKWIKGLFLGFNRLGYTYHDYLGEFPGFVHTYLPVFVGLFRSGSTYANGSKHLKQILSVSGRYVLPKVHAEIYAEYGSDDNAQNIRDFVMNPAHGAAFTIGFKKVSPLPGNKWLDFNAEITQLAEFSLENLVSRSAGYWYIYNGGYTNQSRIIGSGFGMGSNMQTITATLISGFKKIGFTFQRLLHDPNRDYLSASVSGGSSKLKWNEMAVGFSYQQRVKNFIFYLQPKVITSNNYAWKDNDKVINLNVYTGIVYYWK